MDQYTRIPNFILDEWMRIMHASSFTVLMAICRKTLGWQKESDNISLTQIQELTGLTRPVVIKAIKELTNKELIIKNQDRKINNYRLNISKDFLPIQNGIVNNINQTSKESLPIDSKESLHTKESNKENKQNKYYTQQIQELYNYWNSLDKLQLHSGKTLIRNIKKKHDDIIADIGIEESKKAIYNYSIIIQNTNNEYWYSHKFTFWRFLEKIDTFLNSADPLNNYKTNNKQPNKFDNNSIQIDTSINVKDMKK